MTPADQASPPSGIVRRLRELTTALELTDLEDWRQKLVDAIIKFIIVVMPLALVFTGPRFVREGRWGLLAMDVVLWVWAISGFRARKRPLTLVVLVLAITHVFVANLGPYEARPAWLILVPSFGALLFGAKTALALVVVDLAIVMLLYVVVGPTAPAWRDAMAVPTGQFIAFAVNTSFIAAAISVPVGYLLGALDRTLSKERATRRALEAEHEALERAHEELLAQVQERERLERTLRQAQKMEAVGRLASGIAHDLNNILVPVMTYTEFARAALPEDSSARQDLDEVMAASRRARDLVAQVLTFSRDVAPPDGHVVLQDLVGDLAGQLRSTLPKDVRLVVDVDDSVAPVHANRAALFQVALNLTSNAIAAMREGGGELRIAVRAADAETTADDAHAQLAPGRSYSCLEVRDTGVGMDEDTASRVFEPFFTTRQFGEGTGLGLATAHGVVSAFGGQITLATKKGEGATFRVYLPASTSGEVERAKAREHRVAGRLFGRVLLVDDDPHSRASIRAQLGHLGLDVHAVSDARSAEAALETEERFDLLLTDNQMPDTTGLDLVKRVHSSRPELAVVLMTGFADKATEAEAERAGVARVLPKPFEVRELAVVVADALASSGGAGVEHTG